MRLRLCGLMDLFEHMVAYNSNLCAGKQFSGTEHVSSNHNKIMLSYC